MPSKNCQGKYHSVSRNGLKLQRCYSWWININPTDSGWKRKQGESHFLQRETKPKISGESLGKVKSWLHLGHYVTCWYQSSPPPYHHTVCSSLPAELLCRLLVRSADWQTLCWISLSVSNFSALVPVWPHTSHHMYLLRDQLGIYSSWSMEKLSWFGISVHLAVYLSA